MNYNISCQPSFALLEVELEAGEQIVSEAGAMSWMTENIETKTAARGGVMAGLKRALLTGESFFQNTYTAQGGTGTIGLAPGVAGDIFAYDMTGGELFLEKNAYLASDPGVNCDSKFQGLRGLFSEGLFVLRVTGSGKLFFNAYGDIEEIDVNGSYTVDNGYAVAWEPTLEYQMTRAKKIRSFLFSDQLLLKFRGTGKLWVQSRSSRSFANWVHPYRPSKNN